MCSSKQKEMRFNAAISAERLDRGIKMAIEKLWNKQYIMLLSIEFMMQFGMYLTRPIISSYATALGAGLALAGFLSGLNATTAMAMRPVSGITSDLFSKKALLVVACAFFSISALGYSISTSTLMLGFFCVVQGIAFAFRSSVLISMVALVVPRSKIATGVGWFGIGLTLAGALGPAAGSFLVNHFCYTTVFIMSAVLFIVGLIIAILFKTPRGAEGHRPEKKKDDASASKRTKLTIKSLFYLPVIPLAVVAALLMVAQGTMNSFIILLGNQGIVENASLYFVAYSIVVMGSKPLSGRIADKYGLSVVVIPGMLIAAWGMLTLVFAKGTIAVAVSAVLMGLGQASSYSAMQAESVRGVPSNKMGRATNTFYIGPDIGMGLGPIMSGYVWQVLGVNGMFLFNVICLLSATLIFCIFWAHRKKKVSYIENA